MLNVNRWRKQLGLNPVVATDLSKVTTQVELGSGTAIAIDFTGIAQKSAAMARGRGPPPEPAGPPIEYTLPNGWTPLPAKGGPMSPLASFQVAEGNQEATVGISRFPGQAGNLAMNIDRWRGQVGLPKATPKDLEDIREIMVGEFALLTLISLAPK